MAPQDNYVDLPESGGGAGVSSLNGETGNVNIVAGSNITVTPSGQSITIASTGGGGGVTTVGPFGSTPNANGGDISGSTLTLEPADATHPGGVTTGAQTFAGAKTFSSTIVGSISGNAATVTTNANLTGPITSTGNATAVAAQTGTGSTFVMQASPTLTTPNIGAATGTSLSVSGQLTSTVSTGTAPLAVSSTTQVANLNAATAGTATNIAGGSGGTIPYQSAAGTTAMLSNGNAGQLLSSTGGTAAPEWIDAPYDPSLVYNLFEDFSTGFEGGGSGQVTSDVSWATVQTGSPSLVVGGTTNIPSDVNHPGIFVVGTAAGTTTGASLTTGVFNGAANQSFVIGGGTLTAEALINIPVLSNGTDDATLTWSLRTNAPNVAEVNGIDITYIHATSNNWIIRSTKASSQTSTTSSTAVTAGWHKLKIVADAAGANINYFIDGVNIGTISSNIPTVNLAPYWAYYKTAGTTTLFAGVDYIRINKVFTTPR